MRDGNEEAQVSSPPSFPRDLPPPPRLFPQVGEALLPTLWEVNINQRTVNITKATIY